jgi:hypothetical protein
MGNKDARKREVKKPKKKIVRENPNLAIPRIVKEPAKY